MDQFTISNFDFFLIKKRKKAIKIGIKSANFYAIIGFF